MNSQNEKGMFAKLSDLTTFSENELLRGCCTQGCCGVSQNEILG